MVIKTLLHFEYVLQMIHKYAKIFFTNQQDCINQELYSQSVYFQTKIRN